MRNQFKYLIFKVIGREQNRSRSLTSRRGTTLVFELHRDQKANDGEETTMSPKVAEKTLLEIDAEIRRTLETLARAKRAHHRHRAKSLRCYLRELYAHKRRSIYM
jgi:hypothetical protein